MNTCKELVHTAGLILSYLGTNARAVLSQSADRGNIRGELHHPATCEPLTEQSSTDLEVCLPTAAQL